MKEFIEWVLNVWVILAALIVLGVAVSRWIIKHDFGERNNKQTLKLGWSIVVILVLIVMLTISSFEVYRQHEINKTYQEQTQGVIGLQNTALDYLSDEQYREALSTFNVLVGKVDKDRDQLVYIDTKYQIGWCYIQLSQQCIDDEEEYLQKALSQFNEICEEGWTEQNKEYYKGSQENIAYIYWRLSQLQK